MREVQHARDSLQLMMHNLELVSIEVAFGKSGPPCGGTVHDHNYDNLRQYGVALITLALKLAVLSRVPAIARWILVFQVNIPPLSKLRKARKLDAITLVL